MRIKILRQRKADLLSEAETLSDKDAAGTIDDEGKARLAALLDDGGELAAVNASIEREEKLMDERRTMEPSPGLNEDTPEEREARAPAQPKREPDRFDSLGAQLVAIASASQGGQRDPRLQWQNLAAASGHNESTGPDGGFLVQTDFATELLRLSYDRANLASRVRRVPISGNSNSMSINAVKETSRADGSRFGGIQAFWTGEGQQKTASQLQFRSMDLRLQKLTGLSYVTDELLADASALETVLRDAFADEFAFKLDDAIFRGSGTGMPKGFMSSPALVTVPKESGQAADTLNTANILKMWSRMWFRSRDSAIWTINQEIEPQLFTLTIGDKPVYIPAGGMSQAPYATLLGRPVVPTEFNTGLGDKGDIVLFDPRQYLMIEKGGINQAVSMHARFIHDETAFRFVLRVDGQPIWESAVTPYKGTQTLSPYVTLAERA